MDSDVDVNRRLVSGCYRAHWSETTNLKATFETFAAAAGILALSLGLILVLSFGAILFAFFTMAPPSSLL